MSNTINKIFTDKMGGRKAAEYIGNKGDLFYDANVGDLRISDGVTPGGKPTGGSAALGIYRHYQAGCNIFRNTNDQDIAQIFIHNAEGKVDYINFTENTNNDDFYVTGLQHESNETNSNWHADKIIVLNVYSKAGGDLAVGDLRTFVRKFIDTVLYTPEDERVTNAGLAKELFYTNIDTLTGALPAGGLFENFAFDDNQRVHYPEYNGPRSNASAAIKVWIQPSWADGSTNYNDIADLMLLCSGTDYQVGDQIVLEGQQLGGVNGTNDLTITVTELKSGNITGLEMTNAGSNFYPNTGDIGNGDGLNGGSGNNATIRITSCTATGAIAGWEFRNDGFDYQVGDILTLNYGGDDATFEVVLVGTNGIGGFDESGTAYTGSPSKVPNGYWPVMHISDGMDDQYDEGNWISTDVSSHGLIVDIVDHKMTITGSYHNGSIPLQAGMLCVARNPDVADSFIKFTLVSQATDDSSVWYIDENYNMSGAQVRVDGIPFGGGNVQGEDGAFAGADYVTVYDQSIFAMMAFGADVNSVYYNGEMGADTNGVKDIEVLFGINGGAQDSTGVSQRMITNEEYTIIPTDAGKHIYNPNGNNSIYIPPETTANFPIGTAITFVSAANNPTWISCWDTNATQVWGAGFNTTSPWWAIPPNSMGTMLKVGADKWIVSGAGLYNDD